MTNKFYTQWWFFVIMGVILLGSIGLLSGGNKQLIQEQEDIINNQQLIINEMNETMRKEYQIIEKLQSDYLLLCKSDKIHQEMINIYIDMVRIYEPAYGWTLDKQIVRTC